jgi:hypothetical protein
MPAQSKAQRRLFALALQFKRGELAASEVSDEVKDLSKLPEKDLKDYAETKEEGLPDKVDEDAVTVNPNMNVQGMGAVELPGNPGSMDSFANQTVGSGDIPTGKKKKKKKVLLLSFDKFMDLLQTK